MVINFLSYFLDLAHIILDLLFTKQWKNASSQNKTTVRLPWSFYSSSPARRIILKYQTNLIVWIQLGYLLSFSTFVSLILLFSPLFSHCAAVGSAPNEGIGLSLIFVKPPPTSEGIRVLEFAWRGPAQGKAEAFPCHFYLQETL